MKRGFICLSLFVLMLVCTVKSLQNLKESTSASKPKEGINSLGVKVKTDHHTILKKFPYVINRCDQIAVIEGKYIPDFEDYNKREPAIFVLTAYQVSMFKDSNADNLLQTALLAESKVYPSLLKGALGCITVDGGRGQHRMALCTENEKNAENVLAVLKKFYECRGGLINSSKNGVNKPVKRISIAELQKILKNCGLGKYKGLADLKKKMAAMEQAQKKPKTFAPNVYFHPGGENVPGTN